MAGKKGRSGRKARTDGITMRAVALYIPMTKCGNVVVSSQLSAGIFRVTFNASDVDNGRVNRLEG